MNPILRIFLERAAVYLGAALRIQDVKVATLVDDDRVKVCALLVI